MHVCFVCVRVWAAVSVRKGQDFCRVGTLAGGAFLWLIKPGLVDFPTIDRKASVLHADSNRIFQTPNRDMASDRGELCFMNTEWELLS